MTRACVLGARGGVLVGATGEMLKGSFARGKRCYTVRRPRRQIGRRSEGLMTPKVDRVREMFRRILDGDKPVKTSERQALKFEARAYFIHERSAGRNRMG